MEMLVQQPKLRKYTKSGEATIEEEFVQKISSCRGRILAQDAVDKTDEVLAALDVRNILNMKELNYFGKLSGVDQLPKEVFNIVCNTIIEQMLEPAKLVHASFRDAIRHFHLQFGRGRVYVVHLGIYGAEWSARNRRCKRHPDSYVRVLEIL